MKKYFVLLLLSLMFVTPTFAANRSCPTGTVDNPDYDPDDDESEECVDAPVIPESTAGLNCIKSAIDKRDEAIVDALDAYYTTAKSALEKRITDLKTAWGTEKGSYRKADIRDVWTTYKKEIRIANKEFRLDKRVAWTEFQKDKKACRGVQISDDTQAQSADTTL